MPKKKTIKKPVEQVETKIETTEKKTPKIMTVNNITANQPESIEPTTQEVDGKTWIKTTSKRRAYDVK